MSTDEDPEARIRALERQQSGFERAVELTAPSVGTEDHAPARRGVGLGLVVVGAMVAVVAIVGAFAIYLVSHGSSRSVPGLPTASRTAPTPLRVDPAPEPAPSAVPVPIPPVAAPPQVPDSGSGVTLSVTGAGENKTLPCAGRYASVSGVNNTVEFVGECAGLTVSGIGNIVTVTSTPTITVSGLQNRVTYRAGDPQVSTSGFDNAVERG
ncbi:hypothetical protein BST33_00865 [Mycolicibacter minnesotensis]|uniref:Uncharacterized protein n=1 Tax=Mycolicibacter minnesotensis TaxID=1118379 RepID=A0A7I7R9I8_9MYCO|nr:DUF3060 domain-containing protein [Mycolicibacter minnesotensis]ORB04478.1 hypothetical protein BST33_00865 [Mycolicibacter minnesotensis]BBY35072.1 hypothetical protein MMIN_31330 [Mycolicibacter minnesotensis]